jgi:hypothetical protein
MNRTTIACVLAAAAALAGCTEDHTITAGGPDENEAANHAAANANVELPPSILTSKIYRCKDNSVVYVDWLSDNKSANLRTEKNGTPTHLAGPEAGQAMIAEGYSLTGSSTAASVNLTRPGKGAQSCKA